MEITPRNLSFESPRGVRVGYLATPPAPRGAVVVVHEIFGRSPEVERATLRLAHAGYAALMPDLFGARFKPLCIRQALREVSQGRGEFLDVLRAAADALAGASGVPRDRVAVVGFCMGGGLALAVGRAFSAVSTNYGAVPPLDVLRGIAPTIACFGGRDRANRGNERTLRARLATLGAPHEVHHFAGAGHAFLTDGHHPFAEFVLRPLLDIDVARDAGAREAGWGKIVAFLDQHATT